MHAKNVGTWSARSSSSRARDPQPPDQERGMPAAAAAAARADRPGPAACGARSTSRCLRATACTCTTARTRDCGHWHEARAGFVTSHMAIAGLDSDASSSLQANQPADGRRARTGTSRASAFYKHRDVPPSRPSSTPQWFGAFIYEPRQRVAHRDGGPAGRSCRRWRARAASPHHRASARPAARAWNNDPTPFMTRHDHVYGFAQQPRAARLRRHRAP